MSESVKGHYTLEDRRKRVEARLKAVYALQVVDNKLVEIEFLLGELPLEFENLRDEIEGLDTRLRRLEEEKRNIEQELTKHHHKREELKIKLTRLEEQMKNVRSSKEFSVLQREIENISLDIQLSEKESRTLQEELNSLEQLIAETRQKREELQQRLVQKEKELKQIIEETRKEEEFLKKIRERYAARVRELDERLYRAYERIRRTYLNRRAVVTFERNACGGCMFLVPPQRQMEVRRREAIYPCENCGRILIDQDLAKEIEEHMKEIVEKRVVEV